MGKYTAGPWKIKEEEPNSHLGWSIGSETDKEKLVASVYLINYRSSYGKGEAFRDKENFESVSNARLIASAPELLEACKEALKEFNEMGYTPNYADNMLREVIAKAEGDDTKIGDGDIEDYIGGGLNMPKAEGKE